jgi:hypothetical protein
VSDRLVLILAAAYVLFLAVCLGLVIKNVGWW